MDSRLFQKWKEYVPDIGAALRKMEEKTTIAVGVAPYPRIIPSVFLENYLIYCVKDAADIDLLRKYAKIFCLEEKHPKLAAKVNSTGYLLNNFMFQGFLKSQRRPFRLLFYQTTPKIVESLEKAGYEWIGNRPESFSDVLLKGPFRDIVKNRSLPAIPDWRVKKADFLNLTFQDVWNKWGKAAVIQRADFDVAGEMGTFFIRAEEDWKICYDILSKDERYTTLTISPFIIGHSLSMLGCVTPQGVLSSTLQLQLVDVPEALHGQLATGVFLGHDWEFRDWPESAEQDAQRVVESIGDYLRERGYKGIFGIDFLYDKETKKVFPIECNPRFTGALPVYSLMALNRGTPPIELFHFLSHVTPEISFNFERVNESLKARVPLSHISLTPKGIPAMHMPITAGMYSFNAETSELVYKRPGAFLSEFEGKDEFLLIDSIPRPGGRIIEKVPRLFKIIFPRGIATSTTSIQPEIEKLVTKLSTALRKLPPTPPTKL